VAAGPARAGRRRRLWRQWFLPWRAEPGQHLLAVRATSDDGEVQTASRTSPFPEGSSGIQEVVVRIS
jgi:hypothetical protein